MNTQIAEPMTAEAIRLLYRRISALSNSSMKKLYDYVEALLEEEEDAEDIAYIEAHRDDPVVPFDVKDFDTKEPRRHIPLAERLKDWDGQPYELTVEDGAWTNMEPAGEES